MDKEQQNLLDAVESAGYIVKVSKKGHPMVFAADGRWITTFAGTPSDVRSFRNSLAPLKRDGFQWPPNPKRAKPKDGPLKDG